MTKKRKSSQLANKTTWYHHHKKTDEWNQVKTGQKSLSTFFQSSMDNIPTVQFLYNTSKSQIMILCEISLQERKAICQNWQTSILWEKLAPPSSVSFMGNKNSISKCITFSHYSGKSNIPSWKDRYVITGPIFEHRKDHVTTSLLQARTTWDKDCELKI